MKTALKKARDEDRMADAGTHNAITREEWRVPQQGPLVDWAKHRTERVKALTM